MMIMDMILISVVLTLLIFSWILFDIQANPVPLALQLLALCKLDNFKLVENIYKSLLRSREI